MIRVVFFGTPEIAVPFLKALHADGAFEVVAVVCQPDKPAGRGKKLEAPPVKIEASEYGIPVYQFPTLKDAAVIDVLRVLNADMFVVFAYGKIIPQSILDIPPQGCVNVHPSLLPKYRGPSPIQAPILNGDAQTGITIMMMDAGMDTGPILAQEHLELDPRETAVTLADKISVQGPVLLVETLKRYIGNSLVPVPQDDSKATVTKLIEKDDGHIDWSKPAVEIDRIVRAYLGWPSAWTIWQRHGLPVRLKIHEAGLSSSPSPRGGQEGLPSLASAPGTVTAKAGTLRVATSHGLLDVTRIQPEGKTPMDVGAFLNGFGDIDGAVLT